MKNNKSLIKKIFKEKTFKVPKRKNDDMNIVQNYFTNVKEQLSFSQSRGRQSKFCYNQIIQRARDLSEQSV